MEHFNINKLMGSNNISEIDKKIELLKKNAIMIYNYNKKFNLTGFKTIGDIFYKLIVDSLEPIKDLCVPRGTSFVDIGTGSGIPGIPIAIFFSGIKGLLLDSNSKRIDFIRKVVKEIEIKDVVAESVRLEEEGRSNDNRELHDWVFSRAMGNVFVTVELGSPFLKLGGYLYIYSNIKNNNLYPEVVTHASKLGLNLLNSIESKKIGIKKGLLFQKVSYLSNAYPRRFASIKRDAAKFEW